MISQIEGKIASLSMTDKFIELEVEIKSGLTYAVFIPSRVYPDLNLAEGQDIHLFTYLQIRENEWSIYGFSNKSEREFFKQLIGISGIGPKVAVAMLSTYPLEELQRLISEGDFTQLSKVSGLGPKGAKKIVLELQGQLIESSMDGNTASVDVDDQIMRDLKAVLSKLGFAGEELKSMLESAKTWVDENGIADIEELVKYVLSERESE